MWWPFKYLEDAFIIYTTICVSVSVCMCVSLDEYLKIFKSILIWKDSQIVHYPGHLPLDKIREKILPN